MITNNIFIFGTSAFTIQYYTILYNTYYLGSVPGSGNCCLTFGSFSNKPPSATPLRKALTCKWQETKSATDLFDHMFLLLYTYQC